MRDPTMRAVVNLGGVAASLGQLLNQVEQGFMAFGKIGRFGRPIVHLGVDVDSVLAAPRRLQVIVPQALQIGRLAARARA